MEEGKRLCFAFFLELAQLVEARPKNEKKKLSTPSSTFLL